MRKVKETGPRNRKGRFLRQCLSVVLSVALMVTMTAFPGTSWEAQADESVIVTGEGLNYGENGIDNNEGYEESDTDVGDNDQLETDETDGTDTIEEGNDTAGNEADEESDTDILGYDNQPEIRMMRNAPVLFAKSVQPGNEQPILLVSGQGIITDGAYTADNIGNEKSYTLEDLQGMTSLIENNLYSTHNSSHYLRIYLGEGISVEGLLAKSGFTVTADSQISIGGASFDASLPLVGRNYYPNIGKGSDADSVPVGAILAWANKYAENGSSTKPVDEPVIPSTMDDIIGEKLLTLMVGQQDINDINNSLYYWGARDLIVGSDLTDDIITIDGAGYTRGEILMMERADRSYTYTTQKGTFTDYARGVPLVALLEDYEDNYVVSFTTADNYPQGGISLTVGELISGNYMLAYETGTNISDLAGVFDTSNDDNTIHGYFKLYGDNIKPSKFIDSITVSPAGYVDYTDSHYKHINNGGRSGSSPYNIDAITGATLTVEGPGLEESTPIRMGDLEATDNNNLYRGAYTDIRQEVSTELNYEGVRVLAVIDGLVNEKVERIDDTVQIIFKNRWRQDIGSISYIELKNAETPVIMAYGTGTLDESEIAPFVFDGDLGIVKELGNEDGCIKLVYDQTEFPALSASEEFVSVAYIYVERGGEVPGYRHIDALDDAYRNTANLQQLITFTGSALGYEVNYTVEELEGLVEYGEDGLPVAGALGYRDEYGLSQTTYWYVNEYEGIKLWDLLTTELGLDAAAYSTDEDTLVSFAAWDNYQTTAKFSMAQLADPDRFYFYEKSPLDIGTDRPTEAELATVDYWPDNQDPSEWTADANGYPVKKGYPVMLAFGVNGYPYVRDSRLDGYAGGLGNDGGPIRVIFGKTDGLNRDNPSALENYAYFYNNGSNQLQRAQEIYVGNAIRYSTHLENPNYASMKDVPAALTVEIKQGGTTTSKTYTLGELESILYGDVNKGEMEKQGRQEKAYYAHKVYKDELLDDLFEGANLWYLLSEDIGMQGVLGTASFYSGDSETSSLDLTLAELQEDGFNSKRDTAGLGTMVAFAKNGYPMVLDKDAEGYVGDHLDTGKTIKNSDGPLMFVRAQTEAEKIADMPGTTIKNLTKIVVDLEVDVYAHIDDYAQYGDYEVDFTGAVKKEGVTLTVSDIEKMQKYMVTETYTVAGTPYTYRGIELSKLLSSASVGASALMNEITVSNGDHSKTLTVSDLSGGKPVILAYGIGKNGGEPLGKPLVPNTDSDGYDEDYLNSGGPLKLIIDGGTAADCIENVTEINVEAAELSGWTHSSGHYEAYKSNTLSLSGTNLAQNVTMTVEELESLTETYKVFDQYKLGNNLYFEGIDLLKLFRDHIGFTGDLESSAFTVYAKDNYAIAFNASDLTNGVNGKPIILAYGQGTSADKGLPLVDGDDQNDIRDGFDANIGNAFGPLRLIVNVNTGWCNKWVTRIVVGSAGGGEPPAAVDFKLTNGEDVTEYGIKNIKSITEGSGGKATASYVYKSGGIVKTDYVQGIYLSDLLKAADIAGSEAKVTLNMTDGYENDEASYRDIPLADLTSKAYFLAYDAGETADSLDPIMDVDDNEIEATVRIYRNYNEGTDWRNRVTNVSGITISGADINFTFDVYEGTGQAGELPMASVRDVVTDASGGMWVGTNAGGAWYKPADSEEFTINTLSSDGYVLGSDVVQAMAVDSTGGIWFSQSKTYIPDQASLNKGVAHLKGGVITYYSTDVAGTIPNNYVQEVKIDNSGNVWFGSFGGLTRYSPSTNTWTSWDQDYKDSDEDSFPALSVDNIHFDGNGGVWLGFYPNGAGTEVSPFVGGFAHMTADGNITPYQYAADYNSELGSSLLAQVWVRDIAVDADGGAWVVASGSYSDLANVGGNIWYVDSTGAVTEFSGDDLLGAEKLTGNNEVRMVSIDQAGGLWIGTSGDGLYYVAEPGTTAPLTISAQYSGSNNAWPDTIQFNNIYALNIINDVMYLGSDAGVMVAAMEDIIPAEEPIIIESFTISGLGSADIPYYVGGPYDKTFKKLADDAGQVSSSYPYNGATHNVKGALLSTLLADAGAGTNTKVTITTSDGYTEASYKDIPYADIAAQNYFVAYDVGEGTDTPGKVADADDNGVTASFRIYRNLDAGAAGNKDNRIKGVIGIVVSPAGGGGPVDPGDYDLSIEGPGVVNVKKYTVAELKSAAASHTVTKSYNSLNSYGTIGSDTFKGIYLEDLLDDIAGLTANARSITVTAKDGYYRTFNLDSTSLGVYWTDIQGNQIMLAWERNGSPISLQLVIGQTGSDHVNKPMWVSDVETITVKATATDNPGGGTPGGYQGATSPQIDVNGTTDTITAGIEADVTVSGNKASAGISAEKINKALEQIKKQQADNNLSQSFVEIDAVSDAPAGEVKESEFKLSPDVLEALVAANVSVRIKSDLGEMVLSPEVLKQLASKGNMTIYISIKLVADADIKDETQDKVGERPVYNISIKRGSQEITDLNGNQIQVSIPYKPDSSEDTNNLLVYYINEQGQGTPVPSSGYDEKNQQMVFETTHLSLYAVGYNEVTFSDIESHWAKDNIKFLAARGILKGKGAGLFDPNGNVTRAEFVTMLANLAGANVANTSGTEFSDVLTGAWYTAYVNWAVAMGVASGYGDGKFGPDDQITREQMAVMLDKFLVAVKADVKTVNEEASFTDVALISSWAAEAVSRVQQYGIINGRTDGSFAPQDNANRAEAATVIKGCFELQ